MSKVHEVLTEKGLSPDDARMVQDLAYHAAQEALAAIMRVSDTAPDHNATVLLLALTMVKVKIETSLASIGAIILEG